MIKICGVRDVAAADACIEQRVDLVGLNFVTGRRRAIDAATGAELAARIRGRGPMITGVFMDAEVTEVERVYDAVGLDVIQLHGAESPAVCAALQKHGKIIKAISVTPDFDPAVLEEYAPHVWAFLFDGAAAGSGRPFDWSALDGVARDRPVFVAGGLQPSNVADAIQRLDPDGVDTASGVEIDGHIQPDQVAAFCAAVRQSE